MRITILYIRVTPICIIFSFSNFALHHANFSLADGETARDDKKGRSRAEEKFQVFRRGCKHFMK